MSVNKQTFGLPTVNQGVQLIADSGSTKTHWCVVNDGKAVNEFLSDGINPFYQSEAEIIAGMEKIFPIELNGYRVEKVCFYGAGCSFAEKKTIVGSSLLHYFPDATVEIESDLLAAARSLFQHEKGIACILGTGSNSCYYDGTGIDQNVSPLGFILGDEGSGAVLGKLFVADCLKNQLPVILKEKFLHQYKLTPALILDAVYKKPFPNRFLAQFCPFILEHIEEPSVFNLVFESFDAFFVRNVMQYTMEDLQVGFIGSIAYCFKDTLEIVASERRITISEIVQSPMEGLLKYHSVKS
jgi:N-acetylglucosamine kinase-like BadF-type ATPase